MSAGHGGRPHRPGGAGQTVAIVDAYNDPYALTDVANYRSTFGLPKLNTCSVSSGKVTGTGPCIARVGQTGSTTSLPRSNGSWSQEISLDLDMVSAVCQNGNILLVEASSSSMTSLGSAVNEAVKLGPSHQPEAEPDRSNGSVHLSSPRSRRRPAPVRRD